MSDNNRTEDNNFEQLLISNIAMAAIVEQRRARRWGIFFKLILAGYVLLFLLLYVPFDMGSETIGDGKHAALVDIEGVISSDSDANADYIVKGLRSAFEDEDTAGIILRINSPGGSPVQAGYVNDEITRLRGLYPDIPLYAVITDICASGGYYIAAAADQIYANESSVVGSIGVIMSGFGFVDTIEKLGIERRLMHAGKNKGFLDPFSPLKTDEVEHVDLLLEQVYQQFIDVVKTGRGDRLQDDEKIFSGLIWTGKQSLELGLIDGLGSAGYVAREVIGVEEIIDFTHRDNYLDRFAKQLGATIARTLSSQFELR